MEQTDLVITATPSITPVIPDNEKLIQGKTFVGFGSYKPEMREFPESLFRNLKCLFVDTDHAINESGDLIDPLNNEWISKEQVITAGKLVSGEEKADLSETLLFKSVGMALFDLVVSDYIYRKAKEQGIGTEVEL
jgi:ornithine cyclodeaminase